MPVTASRWGSGESSAGHKAPIYTQCKQYDALSPDCCHPSLKDGGHSQVSGTIAGPVWSLKGARQASLLVSRCVGMQLRESHVVVLQGQGLWVPSHVATWEG
jgi:hypothetical protein